MKADRVTEIASTKPNSRKRPPATPGRNEMGMNTAASVAVVEMTAKNTSRVPTTLAARTVRPMLRQRMMFSSTMMASSTTMPVASTSARSVMMLTEKPTR